MKSLRLALLLVIGLCFAAFLATLSKIPDPNRQQTASSSTSSSASSSRPISQRPTEYQLASLDAGYLIDETAPENQTTLNRFRYLLNRLSTSTGSTKTQVADITVSAQTALHRDYGKDMKLLDLMEAANTLLDTSYGRSMSYAELMAALTVTLGH